MSNNYPPGADNSYAPWWQPSTGEKTIEVCVSVCISKTVPVTFDIEHPDDMPNDRELEELVAQQLGIPKELEYEGWNIDEIECIPE